MDILLIDELISVLEKETAIYEAILKLSKSKTNIIVEGKVSELEGIVKLEQSMVLQMGKLEGIREELVDKITAQMKIAPSEITITDLAKLLPKEQANRLQACQNDLVKALRELKDANELNSKLIKNSLEYIDFSINLIVNIGTAGNIYGNSGQTSDSKKRNFFDVKL